MLNTNTEENKVAVIELCESCIAEITENPLSEVGDYGKRTGYREILAGIRDMDETYVETFLRKNTKYCRDSPDDSDYAYGRYRAWSTAVDIYGK